MGEKRKIVIIFDELDKTDSAKRHEHSETLPEFEKLSVRPEQKVSSRTRKQEVLRIIANMKFFFSTARAYFIFHCRQGNVRGLSGGHVRQGFFHQQHLQRSD